MNEEQIWKCVAKKSKIRDNFWFLSLNLDIINNIYMDITKIGLTEYSSEVLSKSLKEFINNKING